MGQALNADRIALQACGYSEQEFLLGGQAHRYLVDDAMATAQRLPGQHAFVTRLLARYPTDPTRFNGTVVVEWLNVSTGQDVDFLYASVRELLTRAGYAWVGVSAQRMGAEQLPRWNATRYGKVFVAAPNDRPDQQGLLDPPLAQTAAMGGDVLCWDIFGQVAQVLRQGQTALLPGLTVKTIIASGESQAAFRLSSYYNSIHPLHQLYDGFLLYDRGGPFALRSDVSTPLIAMGSEFMSEYLGASPPDTHSQRWWEVAGAAHASVSEIDDYIDPQVLRDGGMLLEGQPATLSAVLRQQFNDWTTPLWSRVPNGDVMKAALHALQRWVREGHAPARVPRLELEAPGRLRRDAQGRVLGGLRTSAYDAPLSTNLGAAATGCALAGYHLDFDLATLQSRYGSLAGWLAQADAIDQANMAAGLLLPEDAQVSRERARQLARQLGLC